MTFPRMAGPDTIVPTGPPQDRTIHERSRRLQSFLERWRAAEPAGLSTGPGDTAQAALDRAAQLQQQARQMADTAAARTAAVDALVAGDLELDAAVHRVTDLDLQERAAATAADLLRSASVRILGNAEDALRRQGEALVTEHTRPATQKAVAALARLAPKLDGITDDAHAMSAGKTTAEAWRQAYELQRHVASLREAGYPYTGDVDGTRYYRDYQHWDEPLARPAHPAQHHPTRYLLDAITAGALPTVNSPSEVRHLSEEHDRRQAEERRRQQMADTH